MELLSQIFLCLLTLCGIMFAKGVDLIKVKEDSDVVLPCSLSSKENIESKLFDWKKDGHMEVFMYDGGLIHGTGQDKQFEGRVSHFGDELKNGNASIKISKTKVSDSGSYSCIFPRLQPPQTFNIQLVVGRCLKPSVVALNDTKDWSQLQCVVREAPTKPKVEWRDSSGKTLPAEEPQATERGGSYDIILQTTVTKTDQYSCVVQSGDICDLDRSSISVQICGSSTVPVIIAVFCTLLAVGIVLGVLFAKGCISFEKYVQRDSPL